MKLYNFGLEYLKNNAPKYNIIDNEVGIITATDSNTFIGVKTLFLSIKDKINFACFNLGLTQEELSWCKSNNLEVLETAINIPLIDKWQTYIKPFLIKQSPFNYTIWIDSDCVVVGDLSLSEPIANKETFFTRHWIEPKYLRKNNQELYNLYPVSEEQTLFINAGVFAINKTKDMSILDNWLFMANNTLENENIRKLVVNWDEGSLLWAIRKTNNGNKIIDDNSKHNFFCETHHDGKSLEDIYGQMYDRPVGNIKFCVSPTLFFQTLLKQEAFVCHLSTCMINKRKYWNRWN